MQYCGIHINAVTYVIIVMAIGLLVDFLMHIMLRYYETTGNTRHAKVKETLQTMGSSIMLGGLTTFLGVIPLAFSTTKIFMTVFISFLAMVTIGCSVGLVVLPVLLSIFGPVATATSSQINDTGTAFANETKEISDTLSDKWGSQRQSRELKQTTSRSTCSGTTLEEAPMELVMSTSQGNGYEAVMEV